uniref:AB hydrolase-1 domain-containing protein n=1 Tax=Setaria digitata TaxID=48799 RepID=A0A915PSX4_9BILA
MPHEDKEQEEEQKARTAYDLIRMRLERLQKNIEKPVSIPQRRDGRKPRPPPDFVRNVVGSSAAAGSAEFHIFRNNRKREMDRLDYMNNKALQEELDEKFLEERRKRMEEEEGKTAKKRLKRQRYRQKLKTLKKKGNRNREDESDAGSSCDEENVSDRSNQDSNRRDEEVVENNDNNMEQEGKSERQSMEKAGTMKMDEEKLSVDVASKNFMAAAQILLSLMRGPKVYAYIRGHDTIFPSNSLEYVGETMLTIMNGCHSVGTVVSPFLLLIAYNRSLLNGTNILMLAKFTVTYYIIATSLRTAGRMFNSEYRRFAHMLSEAHSPNRNTKELMLNYDYQLFAAPVDFQAHREPRKYFKTPSRFTDTSNMLYTTLRDCLSYNIAYTFARVLVYPGSATLLNKLIQSFLVENRRKLIVERGGIRGVLMTSESNRVDTMFVDRREQGQNGDTLVVTCEGNAGFYETGIMSTPLALNYSVLGWNQPGFGESSGMPTPRNIAASIDAVIQYAVHKLGFAEDQIVIYAWSIGGFPATWAAANYPNIKGLILDATFDDLLPLAEAKMPKSWTLLVEFIVRTYFDLPIAVQLASYGGPVTLIRRIQDEMIITAEGTNEERLATNRANNLLKSLLHTRHPKLINGDTELVVDTWLTATPLERLSMIKNCPSKLTVDDTKNLTEQDRNTLIYCLCSKYMIDFDSSHNGPLDLLLFNIPLPL